MSGQGRIASFTIVRRSVSDAYPAPYVVALVDLDVGPRLMSQIVIDDPDSESLKVGAAVSAVFEKWSEEANVVLFKLDA